MRTLLIALSLLLNSPAGAGDLVSFNKARLTQELAPFIGTYIHGNVEKPEESIIVIENGELIEWYPCGNIACTSFQISLDSFGQTNEQPYGRKGISRTTSGWEGGTLFVEKITTIGRRREIERKELKFEGPLLTIRIKRYYERMKFWAGEWIPTTKPPPPISALSIMDLRLFRTKVADTAASAAEFRERLRKRPERYLVLNPPPNSEGKSLAELIRGGHYEKLTDAELRARRNPPVAKILPFKKNCEDDL